jgi:hypothetical protein
MKVDVLPDPAAVEPAVRNGLLARSAAASVPLTWEGQSAWARAFVGGQGQQGPDLGPAAEHLVNIRTRP